MKLSILPYPKKCEFKEGFFNFFGCSICVGDNIDKRVIKAALKLKDKLYKKTGAIHKFTRKSNIENCYIIIEKEDGFSESYTLDVSENSVKIVGGDDAGCFYGIGTLLQLIESADGETIPAVFIEDCPDMAHRGFYHDATRGRVPSVNGIKAMVDHLALLKINSLQLYVEHTFDFDEFKSSVRTQEDYLTADEIIEIDQYCYDNFIDFIPSLSTFGHLYELLMKKEYSHLCELENYVPEYHFWRERMLHHTIDPTNPESFEVICSLIDQYLPLFRSKYFNICCDETFDLANGRNKGKNSAELYIAFVSKVAKHVTNAGKTVMMWGDIALEHPELLPQIPEGTILLNWGYNADPDVNRIKKVKDQNLPQIVCPGTNSWCVLIETLSISVPNITKMINSGFENAALGVLNTNWGDYGHPAHFECSLYGTTLSAALSWNVSSLIDAEFERVVSNVIYGVDLNIIPMIKELGDLQSGAKWLEFFYWQKTRDVSFFGTEEKILRDNITRISEIYSDISKLSDSKGVLQPILTAAKGIKLLSEAAILIKNSNSVNAEWRRDISLWFEDYKKCWLKNNKRSELDEIKIFIDNI